MSMEILEALLSVDGLTVAEHEQILNLPFTMLDIIEKAFKLKIKEIQDACDADCRLFAAEIEGMDAEISELKKGK